MAQHGAAIFFFSLFFFEPGEAEMVPHPREEGRTRRWRSCVLSYIQVVARSCARSAILELGVARERPKWRCPLWGLAVFEFGKHTLPPSVVRGRSGNVLKTSFTHTERNELYLLTIHDLFFFFLI